MTDEEKDEANPPGITHTFTPEKWNIVLNLLAREKAAVNDRMATVEELTIDMETTSKQFNEGRSGEAKA